MTIGTRVTHKRYSWLVGTVKSFGDEGAFVHWHNDIFPTRTHAERIADLRPTPVQV